MAYKDQSVYEYTIKDYAFTAIAANGARFPFSDRVSEGAPDPGESSAVGQGSAPNPTHHTSITREPKLSITAPVDEAEKFFAWFAQNCASEKVCNVELRRKKPKRAAVVDICEDWLPLRGAQTLGTDGNMVPISGNCLKIRYNTTNSIPAVRS